ncbi:MAG: spore germination protein [Bacilli bacterium]|nr:spore germination protein [Bacilli bacterium]
MKELLVDSLLQEIKQKQEDLEIIKTKQNKLNLTSYFFSSMFNLEEFNKFYLDKIDETNFTHLDTTFPGIFLRLSEFTKSHFSYVLNKGSLILNIDDEEFYLVNISKIPKRAPTPSELDPVNLLDGHDGFIENIHDNLALIRKRIKSENLIVEKYILGTTSKTDTILIYLEEFKDLPYIKKTKETLSSYNKESLTNINDLNKAFKGASLLPNVFNTSSPDYVVTSLTDGKAVILIDNSPVVSVLPTTLTMFTTIKNEANEPKYYTFFARAFTILFFFLSVFSIGLIIALTNFHPTLFSNLFMANIQITERGTTFPLFIESIIVLFLFEFFRLISSRSPNNYVQNIIIIFSGLFIGQNAISSGIVGESVLLLASISYVSSFAITNNPHLVTSIDLFRLYNLILSYTFGLLGFSIGIITTLLYFGHQKSVGVSLFSPFSPLKLQGIKNFFFPQKESKL